VVNTDLVPPLPDGPLPPNEVPPGHYVPEPATGLTALIGLAAAGLLQRHRKRTSAV
jgi:MYXO-CTERM domain-containing protein